MNITDSKFYRDKCFINGEWVGADSGETISVNNPATLKEIGTVPKCGSNETKRAIEAANAAWPEWRARSARQRSDILRKWFDLMIENKEELAQMMTIEQVSPLMSPEVKLDMAHHLLSGFLKRQKEFMVTQFLIQ